VPAQRIHVTGSVKYDGVCADRDNPRTRELARLLGLGGTGFPACHGPAGWKACPTLIGGRTQAPEGQILLDIYRRPRRQHPNLRLILVPRQKDRFNEVATLLARSGEPFVRRSQLTSSPCHPVTPSPRHPVILIDTIGELSALWGLADVAFVGGSLDGKRGGQN